MTKIFFKLNLIIMLLISSQLNSMATGLNLLKRSISTARYFGSSTKKPNTEELELKKSIEALSLALRAAGYTEFEILIINRLDQRELCAQKFCCFSRGIIDPKGTGVLRGDKNAVCLCTRHDKFDTEKHVVQAREIVKDLE